MKNIKIIIATLFGVIGLGFFSSAQAATLYLTPVNSEIGVGEKVTVELKVDSEGTSFNAAQITIRFPKETLEVTALDKTTSAFSFWLEEPQFSNTDGVISFMGGTPYGVSGGAISILKMEFSAKGTGSGTISLTEGAITAADGSGTNILSKMSDALITVIPKRTTPAAVEIQKIPEPQQIVREAVSAEKLPIKPVVKVPLYPDTTSWYNAVAPFTVSWELPLDISGVSTALNKYPNSIPTENSEGLFDNKTFKALEDGVWYLHVRFQNNVGWGATAHYKIAVDTQLPLGFDITIFEGAETDNPTPTLQFKSSDALSGLKEYQVRIGDGDIVVIPVKDFNGTFKLPLQAPGERKVLVKAIDLAGNSIENSMDMKIIPIISPTITFVPTELFPEDNQDLIVKGTSLSGVNVILKVQKISSGEKGEIALEGIAHPNDNGNWDFTFSNQSLPNGRYVVVAQNQDSRGALSLSVTSQEIRVKSKPIIQIGSFQLGKTGALVTLLVIIALGFGAGAWFYRERQKKLSLRLSIVKTDMAKVFRIIEDDIEKLKQANTTTTTADDEFVAKRLQENINKMEGYLRKEIDRAG
ncbi:MAG TPA: cohesin domain-containing protein [Candidatus Paceibacterota bacterium]|nr:cohesin domain-containing protein [Candidatus Paceibacterota bacterium]HPT40198.1 cohesin domain-containing protein [Candidatus Paceibacterota bacterium]